MQIIEVESFKHARSSKYLRKYRFAFHGNNSGPIERSRINKFPASWHSGSTELEEGKGEKKNMHSLTLRLARWLDSATWPLLPSHRRNAPSCTLVCVLFMRVTATTVNRKTRNCDLPSQSLRIERLDFTRIDRRTELLDSRPSLSRASFGSRISECYPQEGGLWYRRFAKTIGKKKK